MQNLKKLFLIFIIPLFSFVAIHKFYVSVTEVRYSDKDETIQIVLRIFIDDLERTLEERYGIKPEMASQKEHKQLDAYLEQYLNTKFKVKVNGTRMNLSFIGKEYDTDVVKCYIEIQEIVYKDLKSIEVSNEILFEQFEEQQNIVHFRLPGKIKSLLLLKENYKGLLNF
ncbi:DUF6702 family protein [Ascidiimonas sp. W6]|uniref:DUF6702 family protein n=1 Tax=Ascidiimonas meishanensis TaxID=3128903 RepID=UPI0030EC9EEA